MLRERNSGRDVQAQRFLENGIPNQKMFFLKNTLKKSFTALPLHPASVSLLLLGRWCKEPAPRRTPFPSATEILINNINWIGLPPHHVSAFELLNLFCILIS